MNFKIKKISISILVFIIAFASFIEIYERRNKFINLFKFSIKNELKEKNFQVPKDLENYKNSKIAYEWSQELLKGGYILFFRHAEREKWIDVQMYDALESDLHNNGLNESRYAENTYFAKAVCLNTRGEVQTKAMQEVIAHSKLPFGYVVSSPSCRARQTANNVFGGYDNLDRILVHRGPYFENMKERNKKLKDFILKLPLETGKNTIVSAHNGVVDNSWFANVLSKENNGPALSLEEGGFYVISKKDGELILEYEFNNFNHFAKNFFLR